MLLLRQGMARTSSGEDEGCDGTRVLKEIMARSREAGVTLVGLSSPFGHGRRLSEKQLWKWYLSIGFEKDEYSGYIEYKGRR